MMMIASSSSSSSHHHGIHEYIRWRVRSSSSSSSSWASSSHAIHEIRSIVWMMMHHHTNIVRDRTTHDVSVRVHTGGGAIAIGGEP